MKTEDEALVLKPWQQAVFDEIVRERGEAYETPRRLQSPGLFNREFGIRVNMGRRMGHTTLALEVLRRCEKAIFVVPFREQIKNFPVEAQVFSRIFCPPATFEEASEESADQWLKDEPLLRGGLETILIVDNASYVHPYFSNVLRAAPWFRYVDLG